jgi:predicted metal-dependent phosphoesterase TrpH
MRVFKADFHIHTNYSIDSLASVESVINSAIEKNLDAIAITDHNSIEGAKEAEKLVKKKKLKLQIIIGEEVSTDKGDLLVYFLKKKIEKGKLSDVLKQVKKQKALCCAAHPFDKTRKGIELEKLSKKEISMIDMIEVFNARVLLPKYNELAEKFAEENGKKKLAGSDAHHPSEIGRATVLFYDIKKLDKKSLLSAKRTIIGELSPAYVHLYSKIAVLKKSIVRNFNNKKF